MKETELQELEQALRAAAPAPWHALPWDGTLGRSALRAPEKGPSELQASFSRRGYGNAGPEAAAIAALRNKAPDLIAALREARRLLGEAHEMLYNFGPETTRELRAEIQTFLGESEHGKG